MILSEEIRVQVQDRFQQLNQPVSILFFESTEGCEYCPTTKQMVTELSDLSEKLTVKFHDLQADSRLAAKHGVDKVPAIVLLGTNETDYGIKFYGIPSGYEFGTLLEDIEMISSGSSGLDAESVEKIKGITETVNIEVFVTPT